MAHLTDEDIAGRVQKGETQWFAFLVERYEPKITRYARKFLFGHEDRQDLIQDIFIKAFTNIKSFDTSRKFSPWIYRIAHNEFINTIKKKGRDYLTFFDTDTLLPQAVYEEEKSEIDEVALKKMLDTSLDKIDSKYREPLVLYYYEELDYQAIADIMHIPISTVGVRLRRGKEALKKVVQELNPEHAPQ
jgi:RNA polymerase sigma-70 factor (ECF subfamily)